VSFEKIICSENNQSMTKPVIQNNGQAAASESKVANLQNQTATTVTLPRLAFTMKETAEILGVSYITVHRLLKRGKLRASDAIRSKVIPRTEIEKFLRESVATN
jgi:excisionase family DNA binding protein